MVNSKKKLLESLEKSFLKTLVPAENDILMQPTYDNDIEAGYIRDFFKGKKWSDITLKQLSQEYKSDPSACLLFMSPIAFRYYLPLYLKICMFDFEDADSIYDTTLWRLTPSKSYMSDKQFNYVYEGYDLEQKMVIAKILQYLAQLKFNHSNSYNDAQTALNGYWKKYLEKEKGST